MFRVNEVGLFVLVCYTVWIKYSDICKHPFLRTPESHCRDIKPWFISLVSSDNLTRKWQKRLLFCNGSVNFIEELCLYVSYFIVTFYNEPTLWTFQGVIYTTCTDNRHSFDSLVISQTDGIMECFLVQIKPTRNDWKGT